MFLFFSFRIFASCGEDTLSRHKKEILFFCSALDFSYLCMTNSNSILTMNILHYLKKTFLVVLLLGVITPISAQRQFELPNSPDGKSKIYVYLPNAITATGKAVVCCPGGGYQGLSMQNEGTNWVPFFMDRGIAFIILKYRMPAGDPQIPLVDALQAIKTVRDSAKVWNINPHDVGIMGFSAGGHLASMAATHTTFDARPDFQILFYPVITMVGQTNQMSRDNLLGDKKDDEQVRKTYSSELQVQKHITPPAIIFACNNDEPVPPATNAAAYYSALRRNHVDATLYIFPGGYHGFGFRNTFPYHHEMKNLLDLWLKGIQPPKADAIRVACIGNSITAGSGLDLSNIHGYPALLQGLLGKDYMVKNFGVSGRTMLNKGDHPYMKEFAWEDCKHFQPQIAIIKLGTNDSKTYNWTHKKDFEKDMQQMINELKALDSKPEIYLAYPIRVFQNSWTISEEVVSKEIIPIINKVAKKNHLKVIDLHSALDNSDQVLKDGVHPNKDGAKLMAETVYKEIVGNL